MPELVHAKGGIRGLIKSGLGHFRLKFEEQQRPSDHPMVIIFVIGGISMAEVREVRAAVRERQVTGAKTRVMLGGTALLSPSEVQEQMFCWSST